MALFLQMVKYTPDGAQSILEGGFENRINNVARAAIESVGGTLKGSWPVAEGDWHWVNLVEVPDEWMNSGAARSGFQLYASGMVADARILRLADAAAVDAVGDMDYRPS